MMLTEFCATVKNYFLPNGAEDIHDGTFTISNGHLEPLSFLQNGQYFRIVGSIFNDGVWDSTSVLNDETFTGSIWAMAVPPDVVTLCDEITQWQTDNAELLNSPFSSESFGGYSYSKASNAGESGGGGYSWKDQFASRLNIYRRIKPL